MQHADATVPHFDEQNWTWMKGALVGTIDRPMMQGVDKARFINPYTRRGYSAKGVMPI